MAKASSMIYLVMQEECQDQEDPDEENWQWHRWCRSAHATLEGANRKAARLLRDLMEKVDEEWTTELEIESESQDAQGGYLGTLQSTGDYDVYERQTCKMSVERFRLQGGIVQVVDESSKKRLRADTTSAPNTSAQAAGDGLQATSEKRAKQI